MSSISASSTQNLRPDYGIDAPGIRLGMFFAGLLGLTIMLITQLLSLPAIVSIPMRFVGAAIAIYGFFMGSYMTYGSRIGKLRSREKMLDLVGTLRPWNGDETVLDIGCGRGLMLIGAAKRLTSGRATGIDLWRSEDQAGNSPEATQENARREGVLNRISIDTGDARRLPYPDCSFDVVMSHWVVHNIPNQHDRQAVLDEMLRVMRPGGVILLADIDHLSEYRDYLLAKGVSGLQTITGGAEAAIMGALSGGSYRPQALIAMKADLRSAVTNGALTHR